MKSSDEKPQADANICMVLNHAAATKAMQALPEVAWDRWFGELSDPLGIGVFGWVKRFDGKSDFVLLCVDTDGVSMLATSSAEYSAEFSRRLIPHAKHGDCKRVEDAFPNVRAIKLRAIGELNPGCDHTDSDAAELGRPGVLCHKCKRMINPKAPFL